MSDTLREQSTDVGEGRPRPANPLPRQDVTCPDCPQEYCEHCDSPCEEALKALVARHKDCIEGVNIAGESCELYVELGALLAQYNGEGGKPLEVTE